MTFPILSFRVMFSIDLSMLLCTTASSSPPRLRFTHHVSAHSTAGRRVNCVDIPRLLLVHAFIRATKTMERLPGQPWKVGALFTDVQKTFHCIRHDLMTFKSHACGFSHEALLLVYIYSWDWKQRVKLNGPFSTHKHQRLAVPQRFILRSLLFNISICDLLLSIQETEMCNYANDATIYICDVKKQRSNNESLRVRLAM